jgi:hypothetical protein
MADFSGVMTFRASPATLKAMDTAANKRGMKAAEWLRNAVATGLALDGVSVEPRDAGSLYNVIDGMRHWALVKDGTVGVWIRAAYKPADEQGGVWLPIEYEDSAPFDERRQYRLAPITHLEPHRVVRTYPIVLKSEEHA